MSVSTFCMAQKILKGEPVIQTAKPRPPTDQETSSVSALSEDTIMPVNSAGCRCPVANTLSNGRCNPVDGNAFAKIYRADFSYLVAAIDNSALLNQLVVRVDKPSVSFNYLAISEKELRPISGGIAAKAGIADNLSNLLSDGKWDPTLTFGPRLNINLYPLIGNGYHRYFYKKEELDAMKCRINLLASVLEEREAQINKELKVLEDKLASRLQSNLPESVKAELILKIDSLDALIDSSNLASYNRRRLDEVQMSMKWSAKRHMWLSFSPDFSPRSINVFDATNVNDQQISEKNLWIATIPITFNYHLTGQASLSKLLSVSWTWERTNDLMDETYRRQYEKEIIKYSDSLGTSPKTYFKTTEKKTFYSGNDQFVINKRLNVQYIQFLNKKQTLGVTATASYVMPDSRSMMNRNYANVGIGLIVPAITSDGKSKLNIVAAVSLSDVGGTVERWNTEQDQTYIRKSWNQRLALSVRVGLPFSTLSSK